MKFNHLNVPTHWRNYWTRYPEGHTILEALISWVSQVDSMVDNQNKLNDNVEQFRNEIEDFVGRFDERLQDEVTQTLNDWQESGFIDVVISAALQWELDDYKATNEQDKLSINQQLSQIVINVRSWGADPTGQEDIGVVLQEIMEEHDSGVLFFPKGTYFLDMDITRTIGDERGFYYKRFTLKGEGKDKTTIKMNTYIPDPLTQLIFNMSLEDLAIDGMLGEVPKEEINFDLTSHISIVGGDIVNCRIDNFNSSIYIGKADHINIENNEFGWMTDHAIYFRTGGLNQDLRTSQLNIVNNRFKGRNTRADYAGSQNQSDPRHAIKITGPIEYVNIENNHFEGNAGNITVTPGFEPSDQIVKNLKVVGNVFYTHYSSVEYAGLKETSFNKSNTHIIDNNVFLSGNEVPYGSKDFGKVAHIYVRNDAYVKLSITNNKFYKDQAITSGSLSPTQRKHTILLKGNEFYNSRITDLRSVEVLTVVDNYIEGDRTENFLSNPSGDSVVIKDNIFNKVQYVLSGFSGSIPRVVFSNNTFINCKGARRPNAHILHGYWLNNTFENCDEVFHYDPLSTASIAKSGSYQFENNILDNTPISLNSEVVALADKYSHTGIFESGRLVNGYYTKYHDGTMIYSESLTSTTAISSAYGDNYRSQAISWTFNHSFTEPPKISLTLGRDDESLSVVYGDVTKDRVLVYLLNKTSLASKEREVTLLAHGRWK